MQYSLRGKVMMCTASAVALALIAGGWGTCRALDSPPKFLRVIRPYMLSNPRLAWLQESSGIPDYMGSVRLSNGRVTAVPEDGHKVIISDPSAQEDVEFPWGPDWYFHMFRRSRRGNHAVICLAANIAVTNRFDTDHCRIGIIGRKGEVHWMPPVPFGRTGQPPRGLAVSDDGRSVALVGCAHANSIQILDVQLGVVSWSKQPEGESALNAAAFSRDGKTVYAAGTNGWIYGIDVSSKRTVRKWLAGRGNKPTYGHRATAVEVSPDGSLLAAGTGPHGQVYVWQIQTGDRLFVIHTDVATVQSLAFSPDSRSLGVSGVAGLGIELWRVR